MGEGLRDKFAATEYLTLCGLAGIVGLSVGNGLDAAQIQSETVRPVIFSLEQALDFASSYGPGVLAAAVVAGLVLDRYRVR